MKIAAIVVTYNRYELLLENLEALNNQSFKDFEILVIDNASKDNTEESVSSFAARGNRRVIYYNTGANIGGAGGFNYGLRKAYELGFDYYWLMDDDTIPTPEALEELLEAKVLLNGHYGYLASKALWTDGTLCRMNIPDFYENGIDCNEISEISRIKRATFVSFFVSKTIVEKVGLPIKDFFIWADDTNYCLRINRIKPGYWIPESIVIHKMRNNCPASIVEDNCERLDRYFYAFRNRYYNNRKEHRTIRYLYGVVKTIFRIIRYSKDRKIERIWIMLKGIVHGISFNPKIEFVDQEISLQ